MKTALIDMVIDPKALERLKAVPLQVHLADKHHEEPLPLPEQWLAKADYLLCSELPPNFEKIRNLKLLQISSAGYSQLCGRGLSEKGIIACNALGVYDVPIGEWTLAMMINLARDMRQMIRNQEAGVWERDARFQLEIRDQTLGIWGYGGIGREAARLAKQIGLKVHVLLRGPMKNRSGIYCVPGTGDSEGKLPDKVFQLDQKEQFLGQLDYLLLSMPLTNANRGIVGEAELRALPETAFVLNPARGPLIDEQAMLKALNESWIAGAALDTHYHYPMPPDHPLWKFPNVIMTPHISGSALSPHFASRNWDIFIQNVQRHLDGQPMLNQLTAKQLAGY